MNFVSIVSRAELQALPEKRRLQAISRYLDSNVSMIIHRAAEMGKTSYLYVIPPNSNHGSCNPPAYIVTPGDMVEGLKVKYPGCGVEFSEEWVETRPGVREHRSGILIDWS